MRTSSVRPPAVLDIDCECRPLSWYGGDWVTKEITAIACKQVGRRSVEVWLLGELELPTILEEFRKRYDAADIVTGHFIRGFDLPLINGAMLELGLPPLQPKMTQDTKLDLVRFQGLSKSQENLGAMLGLRHPKIHMDQRKWREANRLTPEGLAFTKRRVAGDVRQHIEMRERLLMLGMLGPPVRWNPKAGARGRHAYQS